MSQDHFKKASEKPFSLTENERTEIGTALSRYLHMADSDRAALINDIEMTGSFRQFGYGSLIGDPSSENDKEYGGIAEGWEKGAFCKDRHYRGTPDKLSVTMGALETENGEGGLPGVVQEISADENGEGCFADRVLKNIKDFALRETSLNPIYEYKVVDITTKRHGAVKALICAADPENPLYLGRDGEVLTIEDKAAIIATSKGVPDSSPRNTGMAYWRDHVHCCSLGGFEPDPKIQKLVELAEQYRAQLEIDNPALFAELTILEAKSAPTGAAKSVTYATPVYNVDVISASNNPKRVIELRDGAIEDADLLTDPLSAARLKEIQILKDELEAPTLH